MGYARALQEGIGSHCRCTAGSRPLTGSGRILHRPGEQHYGVDIAAPMGSPVRSATDGVVSVATYDSVLGNYVEVRAQLGYSYVYGHMSKILTAGRAPS